MGYTAGGDIIWYKSRTRFRSWITVTTGYSGAGGCRTWNRASSDYYGEYKGSGIHHWVLVVGASDDDFLVVDPLSDRLYPFRAWKQAYAYRVLVPRTPAVTFGNGTTDGSHTSIFL